MDTFIVLRVGQRYFLLRHNNYNHFLYETNQMPLKGWLEHPTARLQPFEHNFSPRVLIGRYVQFLDNRHELRELGPVSDAFLVEDPTDVGEKI